MSTNVQYVDFKAKEIVREYSCLVRESSIEPHEITFTILNEAFASRRLTFQNAPDICSLTVAATAKVTADIIARDVVVHGYVKGNVRATGRIEIKKDGSVIGNLTTAQIMIEDDADFKGSIEIDRSATMETDKNISSRAASASAGAGRV